MSPGSQGNILGVLTILIFPIIPHRLCLDPILYLKMCHHPKPSTKVSLTYGAIIQLLPKAIGLLIKAAHRFIRIMHLSLKVIHISLRVMHTYHRGMHS